MPGVSTPEKELSFVKRCRVGSLTLRQVLISAWVKYGVSSKNRSWGNTEPRSSSLLCPLYPASSVMIPAPSAICELFLSQSWGWKPVVSSWGGGTWCGNTVTSPGQGRRRVTLQFSQQLDPRKEIQSEIVREVSSGNRIYLISGRYCIAQYLFLFTLSRNFRACLQSLSIYIMTL